MSKYVVSIFVDNQANVLTRVISLYGRRNFNIDSLTVSTTSNPAISRITLVFTGDESTLDQIITQTEKLEVVRKVSLLEKEKSLFRELLLVRIAADKGTRSAIKEIADIYRAKIVDLSKASLIIELTGKPEKIDGFLEMIDCYDVMEVCRTGITGIQREQ